MLHAWPRPSLNHSGYQEIYKLWFPVTDLEVSKVQGGKVETSPCNNNKKESFREAKRPGEQPECGPASGLILGKWGPKVVGAMWDSFSSHSVALYWTSTTCEPLAL